MRLVSLRKRLKIRGNKAGIGQGAAHLSFRNLMMQPSPKECEIWGLKSEKNWEMPLQGLRWVEGNRCLEFQLSTPLANYSGPKGFPMEISITICLKELDFYLRFDQFQDHPFLSVRNNIPICKVRFRIGISSPKDTILEAFRSHMIFL